MDTILEKLSRGVDELLGRASGPLHFRLLIMPTVVAILAIRAGLRDAREGQPAFLWAILTRPAERRRIILSALKDLARVLIMAVVLDTVYQVTVMRAFRLPQLVIVVTALAVVPYVVVRGPVARAARLIHRNHIAGMHREDERRVP